MVIGKQMARSTSCVELPVAMKALMFLLCALAEAWIQRPWGGQLWFIRSDALLLGCATALLMHYGIDARIRRYMGAEGSQTVHGTNHA